MDGFRPCFLPTSHLKIQLRSVLSHLWDLSDDEGSKGCWINPGLLLFETVSQVKTWFLVFGEETTEETPNSKRLLQTRQESAIVSNEMFQQIWFFLLWTCIVLSLVSLWSDAFC